MKKTCIFCGKSAPEVKMSNEHVIRSFLSNYLPNPPTSTNWHQSYRSSENGQLITQLRKIPRSPLQATSNDVCKICNEGWLNIKVEQPIENELGALIQGSQLFIQPSIALKVSTWASKTCMVRARLDKPPYPIPSVHHTHLMTHLSPPDGTLVWLGFCQFEPNTFVRQCKFMTAASDDAPKRGHLTTIVIGHMALFILGSEDKFNPIVQIAIDHIDGHDLLRLHPHGNTSSWPRSMPMSVDQAKSLSSTIAHLIFEVGEDTSLITDWLDKGER